MLVNKKRRDARWEGEREGGVFQGKASADKMSFDHCHVSDNRHHLNTLGREGFNLGNKVLKNSWMGYRNRSYTVPPLGTSVTAEMLARAATCVTVKNLREGQFRLQNYIALPLPRNQETTSRARLCLFDLHGQKYMPHFLLLVTQETPDRALRLLTVLQKSSASMTMFAKKQHMKQTTVSFQISRGCIRCSLFHVGGILLAQLSCPPSIPLYTLSQGDGVIYLISNFGRRNLTFRDQSPTLLWDLVWLCCL